MSAYESFQLIFICRKILKKAFCHIQNSLVCSMMSNWIQSAPIVHPKMNTGKEFPSVSFSCEAQLTAGAIRTQRHDSRTPRRDGATFWARRHNPAVFGGKRRNRRQGTVMLWKTPCHRLSVWIPIADFLDAPRRCECQQCHPARLRWNCALLRSAPTPLTVKKRKRPGHNPGLK